MNTSLFLHSTYRWMVLSFLKRLKDYCIFHCVKSIRIRRFSGPYFPAFELNTERSEVSPRIQSKCRKKQTWKTPNMDTFHAVFWPLIWLKRSSHLREGCTYEAVKKKYSERLISKSSSPVVFWKYTADLQENTHDEVHFSIGVVL